MIESCDFQHLDLNGIADGWTYHEVLVTPSFYGIDLAVSGEDRDGVLSRLWEMFLLVMHEEVDLSEMLLAKVVAA